MKGDGGRRFYLQRKNHTTTSHPIDIYLIFAPRFPFHCQAGLARYFMIKVCKNLGKMKVFAMLRHLVCILVSSSILEPSWGQLGALLGPSWAHLGAILGPCWAILGPCWGHLWPSWGQLGPSWAHVGAILYHLGVSLGPSWAILGPCWAILGQSWGHLGPS